MTTATLSNNTLVIDQPGHPAAGLQATEPQRPRTMLDLINSFPGKPWYDAAGPLAQWTLERLVNRDDAYRGYRWLDYRVPGRGITFTAPWNEDERVFGALNREIIEGHYRGDQERLLGLHAISVENTCKWFAVDVDQHGADGPVLVEENIDAAFSWYGVLQVLGFSPLFLDANGEGGFHLLVCLSEAVPSQVVHGFVTELVQDFGVYGLKKAPAVYPGEPEVNPHRPHGSWLRLPGRHHTRSHWTKVWGRDRWLEDQEAVDAILGVTGDSPDLIPGVEDLPSRLKP